MQPISVPPSRLPTLRQGQRSSPLMYDIPRSARATAGGSSHVSNFSIAAAHRALHSSSIPTTSSGTHSLSSLHPVSVSDNNGASNGNAAQMRFAPNALQQQQQQQQGSPLQAPSSIAATAAVQSAKLDAPAQQELSHLEYTSQAASLPPQLYLPKLQQQNKQQQRSSALSAPTEGLLALQDATTGLLVRHLTPDRTATAEREAASLDNMEGARMRSPNSPAVSAFETARTEALMKATPFVSAALLDAGVDDRIYPFLLDKMIRQGMRQVATAETKKKADKDKTYSGRSTPAAVKHTVSMVDAAGTADASLVTHYHEPPALQAAYNAIPTRASSPWAVVENRNGKSAQNEDVRRTTPQGGDAFAEIVAEYASGAQDEEAACAADDTPHSSPPLREQRAAVSRDAAPTTTSSSMLQTKAMLLMSSPDYIRLASAASANDAAFVRQLVNYYTVHARAATAAASAAAAAATLQKKKTKGTNTLPASGALTSPSNGLTASQQAALTAHVSATGAGSGFSLLDAVLAVSREYVEVQASEVSMPGKGTAALSERRRHLLSQLVTLDQTRIPMSLWVTCAPPLSRLSALTTTTTAPSPSAATCQRPALIEAGKVLYGGSGSSCGRAAAEPVETNATSPTAGDPLRSGGDGRASRASVEAASIVATQRDDSVCDSQQRPRATAATSGGGSNSATSSNIFPAARPIDRSQVYLLADVLDRMLHDPSHPRWVELLSNPEVARYVFADNDDNSNDDDDDQHAAERVTSDAGADQQGVEDSDGADSVSYETLWGPPGEQRLMAYTEAAHQVLEILDTGLSELVRQVACQCTERGALLDLLRQSVVDIATTQVHLLGQVKQQARRDAATAATLRAENADLKAQVAAARRELAELEQTHAQLQARIEPIQRKSDRLDELTALVAGKARRFETHRHDEHIALLQLLEESMQQTAAAATDSLYNEVNDMHMRHAGEEENGGAANGGAIPSLLAAELPSVTAARVHAAEQRQTMNRMYLESHQLLRTLQDIVEATNAVCAPLFQKMILTDVSPIAKVATSKWTTIARAVGAFEKEKRHRQRVYEVFTEYCTVFRHTQAAALERAAGNSAAAGGDGDGGKMDPSGLATDSHRTAVTAAQSYGESFLVEKPLSGGTSGADSAVAGKEEENDEKEEEEGSKSDDLTDVNTKLHALQRRVLQPASVQAGPIGASSSLAAANPLTTIITHSDLEAMSATDCTVEEVNALFRSDFDVRAYLRGSWEDYINDRRAQETAAGVDAYTLRLPDLLQMLSDMHATLTEVTMRMRAMADSGMLQALLRPPLEPPANPEVPCPLCGRRDTCEMDRQRRREAMSRIARDLQGKMDAVEAKSRAAQLERDEAKREVRRLQMELQQVSQGNMPQSTTHEQRHSNVSNASTHAGHDASIALFRRMRRNTSTPHRTAVSRAPSFANASTRSAKGRENDGGGRTSRQSQSRTSRPSRTLSGSDAAPQQHRQEQQSQSRRRRDTSEGDYGSDRADANHMEASSVSDESLAKSDEDGEDEEEEDDEMDDHDDTAIPSNRRVTAAM